MQKVFCKFLFVLTILSALFCAISCTSSKNTHVRVPYEIQSPYTGYEENALPRPLYINFYGSAARMEDIDKEPAISPVITPEINGKWKWNSDTELCFTPAESWKLSTKYTVTFDKAIFADHVIVNGSNSFITDDFYTKLSNCQFYIDPENPSIKKVTATIRASHPIKKESISDYISLEMQIPNSTKRNSSDIVKQNVNFKVTYNKNFTEAYIVSDNIPMPPRTSKIYVTMKSGIKAEEGAASKSSDSHYIEIPGMSDYVKVKMISHALVKNNEQNYDQIFTISTKGEISSNELYKNMEVYILPKDRPEEQGWRKIENYNWNNSSIYITELVLSQSEKINVEPIPTPEPASVLNSFKFNAPSDSYVYIKLNAPLNFFGGYILQDTYESTFKVKRYPVELGILSDGTILSLSGSNKMALYSRGIESVKYSLARIMPKDINHLISMSNGDMRNFRFSSYNFNENNISEKEYSEFDIPEAHENKISYFSYDFSDKITANKEKHLSNGLFLFEVQSQKSQNRRNTIRDKRLILITDLGFFVKTNSDNTRDIFVQSISTGLPVSNAEVEIIGLNGNTLVKTTTDRNGHAVLPYTPSKEYFAEHKPVAYVVKTSSDLSFMPYSEYGRSLDYSNYDIGGEYGVTDPKKINAYIFSDRGMYRPGDKANIGIIVKAGDWSIDLKNTPLECEVTDSNESVVFTKRIQLSSSGFEEISFSTQENSPTGKYSINLYLLKIYEDRTERNYLTSTTIKVEEFLPDTLKINTHFDPIPADGWINPGDLKAVVDLKNLFGTPAAGNTVKSYIELNPGVPSLRRYSDFYFENPYLKKNSYSENLGSHTTDENGRTEFEIDTKKFEKASYRLNFYAEGFEKGNGRSVNDQTSIYISPLKYLIGYKADGKLSYINKLSKRVLTFIAIDQNLEKIDLEDVNLTINEIKYISTLVQQPNGLYKYQSVKKDYVVSEEKINISKEGTKFALPSKTAGEYKIILTDKNGLVFNTINFTIVGDENITRSLTRTTELELSIEKADLDPGSTAKVFIKAPYEGSGLITIERDKVYTYKWFKTSDLSTVQTIEIPSNLEGNGYINVMFTRAPDSEEIFMSPFCYGAIPFSVSKSSRTNNIKLEIPDEIKSGTDLTINYSSSNEGKIVIFAVDEGILQVAKYKTPDPLSFFFKKRALEVRTAQIMDLILPEYNVLKTLSATGGSDGMMMLARNLNPFKRKTNAPVVFWSGIVDTGKENRSVTYHVPEYYNGSLRVMAVAVSKDTVGAAQTSTLARNTFIISPNAPTQAAPDDEFEITVTVTNNHKKSGENIPVTLTARPSKHLQIIGEDSIPLTISEGSDATATFRVKANNVLGTAEIRFTAEDSTEQSSLGTTLSVRPAVPYQVYIKSGKTEKNQAVTEITHHVYDEFSKREASVSMIPASFTNGLNFYLEKYPYGCSEQITSKAYPYLYEDFVKKLGKTRADSEKMVSDTIAIMQSRMKRDGNIGYWTNKSDTIPFITLYCADFLTDAKAHNFFVPSTLNDRILYAVQKYASSSDDDEYGMFIRSYAIYILTKNEFVTTSYIESLENDITRRNFTVSNFEGLYLAASYAMLKQDKKANEILAKCKRSMKFNSSWYFTNNLHYASTYIDVICRYFPARVNDIKSEQIETMCEGLKNCNYNTLSVSAALKAFESLSDYQDNINTPFEVTQTINNTEEKIPVYGKPVLSGNISDSATSVTYNSNTNTTMFYQTVIAGFDKDLPGQQKKDIIEINREYKVLDKKADEPFEVGDTVTVLVSFRSVSGSYNNMAIIDMVPAGFEIDVESIRNSKNQKWTPDYVDIREDRVVVYGTINDRVNTFMYTAKATNKGIFTVPPAYCESMYNKDISAITPMTPIEIK